MLINFIDWKMIMKRKKWLSGKVKAMSKLVNGQELVSLRIWKQKEWDVCRKRVGQGCTLLHGPHTVLGESSEAATTVARGSPLHCSLSARYLKEKRERKIEWVDCKRVKKRHLLYVPEKKYKKTFSNSCKSTLTVFIKGEQGVCMLSVAAQGIAIQRFFAPFSHSKPTANFNFHFPLP